MSCWKPVSIHALREPSGHVETPPVGVQPTEMADMCWSEALRGCQPSIKPEYSLEGPMPKLKFQYMGHLMRRANDSLEKTLMLGKTEGRRRRG